MEIKGPNHNSPTVGLSSVEAIRRHQEFGPNEIVPSRLESGINQLRKILLDPMGLMLLGLAILYFFLGDETDALILLFAYIPVTGVDVLLEIKTHKALKALRSHVKTQAKVFRDGAIKGIPTRELVVGDVLIFEEGQSLPADGKAIEAENLTVNESALTGESVPVDKSLDSPFWGGTTVLQGRGLGLVEAIGKETRFGKVASLLEETEAESTPLQKKVNHLVKRVLSLALIFAGVLFTIEKIRGAGWIQALIVSLTFGMAAVPEEFPLVFTLYLSLGAWRLSRHGVLVKSLPSVEALGSVDVICTDKTGTLTEGKFQLESMIPIQGQTDEILWRTAWMACEKTIVDSMEAAIVEKGRSYQDLLKDWDLEWDYPFESRGKHMSHVWKNSTAQFCIAMKGAIEGVLEHCQTPQEERSKILKLTEQLAGQGKRLLGLAYREGQCTGNRETDEKDLTFLGILVFNDPVRSSAKEAVFECQRAGIEVKMLTGDHPITAHAVADEIGIEHDHELLFTGEELAGMSKEKRWLSFQRGSIFSRVVPEQKHEMVQALKASGKIVAMTGDGINDAPALKLADIGISMGVDATDVARSSAEMILLKNDFKGIVEAVFEGRKIFSNLKRSFSYLISFHVPVILLALLPPLFGWGDLLLPVHIVLLELIVHPVSAFAFENLAAHGGRNNQQVILSKTQLMESLFLGALLSFGILVLFHQTLAELGVERARTLAVSSLLVGISAFVFIESYPVRAKKVIVTILILLSLVFGITLLGSVGQIFHLVSLSYSELLLSFGVGILSSLPSLAIRARK